MEYNISESNKDLYTKIYTWYIVDLHLKLVEAALYGVISVKGFTIFDYNFIAKILGCDSKTVYRTVKKLREKDLILVIPRKYKNVTRAILIAMYNESGKVSQEQINKYIKLGTNELNKHYKIG